MEELIKYLAKSLVENPEQVEVRLVGSGRSAVYELSVADADRGRVIGRGGQTIQAMRTILKAAAASDERPMLEIPG